MATVSRNPWDADPAAPTQAPWASDPVVTSAKNPWDNDPVAAPAARTQPTAQPPANPEANVKKFLDFLGRAEGADYNTIVGGSKFSDFRAHPKVVGLRTAEGPSTAAGKYQIVGTTYDAVAPKLGIRDFSPDSQDKIAIELIRQKGALEDVRNGNFDAAVGKLGGIWASLPSSPYSQPKRSAEWVAKELGSPTTVQYQNFAQPRKNVDPASLNKDQDWLRASELLYSFYERKPFQGTKDDLAEWGKDSLGNFNFNLVSMAEIAYSLQSASQEEKEAFLFMMDTYDNTDFSLEGAGRAAKGIVTDPTNLVGLGTLGVGFLGKFAGKQAAKAGIRKLVLDSMARTGIAAGIQSGVVGAADSSIRQGIEVSAGRREEIDLSKVGVDATIAGTAGLILGTAADAAVTKVVGVIKGRKAVDAPTVPGQAVVPVEAPKAPTSPDPNVAGVTPKQATPVTVESLSGSPDALDSSAVQAVKDGNFTSVTLKSGEEVSLVVLKADNDPYAGAIYAINKDDQRIAAIDYTKYEDADGLRFNPNVYVEEKYQRQGLATKLYDLAEADGAKIPSLDQDGQVRSEMGQAFREARAKGKPDVVAKEKTDAGAKLSPAEEAGLIQRQQDGRLRADEVVPAQAENVQVEPTKNLPITENKAGEKFYDTRSSGERFHGSSSEITAISDDYAMSGDSRNIYGQGFYTTDAVDISNGYMKKGKGNNPTLYKIEEVNNPKMYNMEAPLTPEIKKEAETIFGDLYRTENGETGKPITNMRELFDEIRAESKYEGYSRDDVQEMFDSLRYLLERQGYNGYEHLGGANTGNKAHNVKIYWTPEQHIKTTKVDIGEYRPGTKSVPKEGADVPKIDVPQSNTGLRTTRLTDEPVAPLSKAELAQQADVVVTQLREVPTKDLPTVLETLRTRSDLSREEIRVVDKAVQNYKNEVVVELATLRKERMALDAKTALSEPEIIRQQELAARIEDLEARAGSAQLADDATGSMAGSILQDRQDPMNALKGVTVESIMAEKGVTKVEAEQVWAEMVGKAHLQSEGQKISAVYDDMATKALEADDLKGAMQAAILKNRELDAKVEALAPKGASFIDKLTEFSISNVFSIKTIIINLIPSGLKTLVIPGLKAILNNPFEKATRAEAAASYSAMRSSFGAALNAAKAGFRYEHAILSRDGTRLVEGEMAMTGKLAGAWRIFPRILNASDEFLSRINYDSFVAGKAAAEAAMEGTEKGLKGKALDDFISEASKKALDASMKPTTGDELVNPIINKGLNLGLTGEDLFKWVEKEAMRDPQSLRKGNDEEALNFVRDVLYKRKFSGEGSMSKAAQAYEDAMKKFPTVKLVIGQLFFRTPIRVFEEGIRLTPGLQFVAPNFMQDLAGANGALRQVRAQAEAMTSLVIASGVLSLYAQGRIQGDGAYEDYKQQKTRVDGPLPEPYTIKMSDGSTWNYRGFDPLATPVKIMVNALQRMDQLRLREAQGEFVGKDAYKQPLAAITVGAMSISSAIRDASLVEGADNFAKFVKAAFNPEEGESAFIKALGDKLFLLVPNTLHKIARDNDPQMRDPVTFWQMVEQKLLRPVGLDDPSKTAFAYDVLGNPRQMADTGSLWNVFSTASVEERAKGMNEQSQFVLSEMDRLTRVTGVTFKPPVKAKEMGDADMRTIMAADGKRTLFDVWQQNYKSLQPEAVLYPILKAPLPEGTFKYRAAKVEEAQAVINDLQSAAMAMTMKQEQKVVDKFITNELLKAKSKAGLFDTPRPY